jgi:hypothetical protein
VDSASLGDVLFRLQDHDVAFVILSRENHTLRLNAHHRAPLEVEDERAFLAHKVLGLVPLQKTSHRLSFFSPEIHQHLDEVSGARDVAGFRYLSDAQVKFLEFVECYFCAQAFTDCVVSLDLFLSFSATSLAITGNVSALPDKP